MALVHVTTMSVSKIDMLAAWLPSQSWFDGDATQLVEVAQYRFDDPEGEVGLNGVLVTAGDDTVYHVPMTWRAELLEGGEEFFIGNTVHGVLGTRWGYDGIGDPVFRAELARAIAQGGTEVRIMVQDAEGNLTERVQNIHLTGSGEPGSPVPDLSAALVSVDGASSTASTGLATLRLVRAVRENTGGLVPAGAGTLTGTWPGQEEPAVIATLE